MRIKNIFLLASIALLAAGCAANNKSSLTTSNSSETSGSPSTTSTSSDSSESSDTSSSNSGNGKVIVPAHTLSDNNPPINVNSTGQTVSESTWNSFKNGAASKFNGHYNFTYKAYSGGVLQMQYFTKNGYYIQSSSGKIYYERKSGSTFYQYVDVLDGWLRQETTLDIQSKYTSIFTQEIYVHMFDFSNYEYDADSGRYYYITTGFGSTLEFKGGYLTYMMYGNGASVFEIYASFETTIDIPRSYYYE